MTEKINLFDYGTINSEQKKVAEEIAQLALQMNQPMLAELIKQKFKIVDIPLYDISKTNFINKCKEINVKPSIQGYILEDNLKYPILCLNEDIRTLEKLFE
jgi:hypothetical protein